MGERHGDGGAPDRRVAHPANPGGEQAALETLLAAAIRGRAHDTEARTQAVAAFRVARDGGAHAARTRRRDDWRPNGQRRPSRSMTAAFAALLAGLTLGGVAVAAIGSSSHEDGGHRDRATARPSNSAPDRLSEEAAPPVGPGAPGISSPSGSAETDSPDRPPRARDTEAHCRAYASVGGRGNALNSKAWQRLVAAAGGEDKVEAYCAEQLAERTGAKETKGTGNTGKPGNPGNTDGTPVPGASAATPKPTKSKNER
ncbi:MULTISPECIES: hypothetical protein [unclassified Streptomyces]|uniref:hypothetical protein n=1 Tax=unclassified Streptomyces TaxID=2593676 RepID=UPI0033A0AB49